MNNSLTTAQATQVAGVAGVTTAYLIFALILCVVEIVATWKIFTKAGKPGWASIIPIYNVEKTLRRCLDSLYSRSRLRQREI